MKIKVSFLLVISLLIFSLDLPAKERRGAELVVTKNDGQVLKGELIAVKPDSLLLISPTGKDESVRVADIATIRIVKKSKAWQGFLIGFVPGAVGGAIWWGIASDEMPFLGALLGGLIVGAATGLVGLAAGVGVGLDSEIHVSGLPESELNGILAKLDGKARQPGVFIPKPIEPTVRELGVKPARPAHEWKRFRLTWLPGFNIGGNEFLADMADSIAYSCRSALSLGRVTMAYQWSRKLAAEVELYVTKYETEYYSAVFYSNEAVSSTSLLFGLTFKPLAPASLQPHAIEIGAAAGPIWIRTSVSEWWGEDSTAINQGTTWTARVRVSYDYHFAPWFSIGAFGEYRWLQADVPSYVMTEVTLPARTINMGGVACGLKLGFGF